MSEHMDGTDMRAGGPEIYALPGAIRRGGGVGPLGVHLFRRKTSA
jgi:hypothetical protein